MSEYNTKHDTMKKLYARAATTVALPLLFAACSVYQLNTIASTNTERNEIDGSFVQENDSLKIIYSFNGQNAPVSIEIHNKLNEPLLIDWQRSALLYNDSAVSYAGNKAAINGSINGIGFTDRLNNGLYNSVTVSSAGINGTITLPQYSDFIPPHAFIKRVPLSLTDVFFENFSDTLYKKVSIPADDPQFPVQAKKAVFSQSTTPLTFSSYLTFSSAGSDAKKVSYQQSFYIAELIKMPTHPNNTALMSSQRGDVFFVSKQTGYGKTMTGVGAIVAIGAIAGAGQAINNNNTNHSSN